MIGIIICGHGNFATGLYSSMELIAGKQDSLIPIDFTSNMSPDGLMNELKQAINDLEELSSIVIFTDIPGGTPFNKAVSLSNDNVKVVSGLNLPSLLESVFNRNSRIDEFVETSIVAGKEGFKLFRLEESL